MVHADVGLPRVADVGDIFDALIRPGFADLLITDERFHDGTLTQGASHLVDETRLQLSARYTRLPQETRYAA